MQYTIVVGVIQSSFQLRGGLSAFSADDFVVPLWTAFLKGEESTGETLLEILAITDLLNCEEDLIDTVDVESINEELKVIDR